MLKYSGVVSFGDRQLDPRARRLHISLDRRILTFSVRQLGLAHFFYCVCVARRFCLRAVCDRAGGEAFWRFTVAAKSFPTFRYLFVVLTHCPIYSKAPLFVDPAVCRGGSDVSLTFAGKPQCCVGPLGFYKGVSKCIFVSWRHLCVLLVSSPFNNVLVRTALLGTAVYST